MAVCAGTADEEGELLPPSEERQWDSTLLLVDFAVSSEEYRDPWQLLHCFKIVLAGRSL